MSTAVGLSACCISGKVHEGRPVGREEEIGGLNVYTTEPKNGVKTKTLVFITDIFGWEFNNTRLLADEYAEAGFYCYVPDLFAGDSLDISFLDNIEPNLKKQESLTVIEKVQNAAIVPITLGSWLRKHTEAKTKPLLDGFINTLRSTPGTNKIGAIGFCWGGRYAILEAHGNKMDETGSTLGGVDAAFACHPSLVTVPGDFDPVSVPLSLAVGTKDSLLDNKSVGQIQELMDKKTGLLHEIRIYEDQIHGFALRSDWSSDKDKEAMDEALKQGVEWFQEHLS